MVMLMRIVNANLLLCIYVSIMDACAFLKRRKAIILS